ncbi:mucin-5AC [Perca flavescens]|uniref:mucin-5AC n=1 Tax=Perca flavescens TaxID=8167 RepID=UPI00106E7873|nr:mucin-5AC-like [Perca flavescens]XP_028424072.1 mucin-5AC-like [Perca flavescens]XP_028424073.1 mucin-5AC-like [Perca flavescens]
MARPGRPASESYQPVCCSVSQSASYSSEARTVGAEDRDDHAPIFSLSKSSMDVVMATGPPHKRDPAWTRLDLRRSSSTNTHAEQNSVTLQQLHPRMWQHINSTTSNQLSLTGQHVDVHSPPALGERWITNMHRWSECSGSTHSRSSTPDTVVWKGWTSRPSSLTQETLCSPLSKPTSPPTTPSPCIPPLQTPTLPHKDLLTSSSSSTLSTHQQEDSPASSPTPTPSPLRSPQQAHTSSPLPSNSSDLFQPTSTEDDRFLENNSLFFTFPSPLPSSVSLAEEGVSSDPGCLVNDVKEELHSPGSQQLSEDGGVRSPVQMLSYLAPNSPADGRSGASVCHLELPWQPGQSCPTGRGWRSPLVSSLSDSLLGCRCHLKTREGHTKAQLFREEGTMTSKLKQVDAAVQTISPIGSLWGLRTNNSNMGSHSLLGSPPGSRLNLKSSVGSNSNLVSPSSSMFPVSSGEEEVAVEEEEEEERRGDNPTLDINSSSSHDLERRRSCLKNQGEEKDTMGRRGSMKQVQWDENGMTWDVHGASVDPEVLSTAIQKHLELQNSPRAPKRTSNKKKAPKPPLISNVVKAMTLEVHPPVMIKTSTCMVEGESEGPPEADGGRREVEEEGEEGGKKEETIEAARKVSRAEGANSKEEDEVYGEEGTSHPKSPLHGSGHSRKKSVIRSLRPGWCGGSRKADD